MVSIYINVFYNTDVYIIPLRKEHFIWWILKVYVVINWMNDIFLSFSEFNCDTFLAAVSLLKS